MIINSPFGTHLLILRTLFCNDSVNLAVQSSKECEWLWGVLKPDDFVSATA